MVNNPAGRNDVVPYMSSDDSILEEVMTVLRHDRCSGLGRPIVWVD